MKKNTIYTLLIVLIVGMFTVNFIVYKMQSRVLFGGTTISIIIGSILLLKNRTGKN